MTMILKSALEGTGFALFVAGIMAGEGPRLFGSTFLLGLVLGAAALFILFAVWDQSL